MVQHIALESAARESLMRHFRVAGVRISGGLVHDFRAGGAGNSRAARTVNRAAQSLRPPSKFDRDSGSNSPILIRVLSPGDRVSRVLFRCPNSLADFI